MGGGTVTVDVYNILIHTPIYILSLYTFFSIYPTTDAIQILKRIEFSTPGKLFDATKTIIPYPLAIFSYLKAARIHSVDFQG